MTTLKRRGTQVYNEGLIPYTWTLPSWLGISETETKDNPLIDINKQTGTTNTFLNTINKPFVPIGNVLYQNNNTIANEIEHPITTIEDKVIKPFETDISDAFAKMEQEFKKIGSTIENDFGIVLGTAEKGGVAVINAFESVGRIVLQIGQFIEQIITTIKNTFELILQHPCLSVAGILLFIHL